MSIRVILEGAALVSAPTLMRYCMQVKRNIKEEIIKPKYRVADLKASIPLIMDRDGLGTQLQNEVYRHYHAIKQEQEIAAQAGGANKGVPRPVLPKGESLEVVGQARSRWESRVKEELHAISREQGRPHSRVRASIPEVSSLYE